jgi:hypothetical protein
MTNEEEDKMLEGMSDAEVHRYYEENYEVNPAYIKNGWFIQDEHLAVKPDGSLGTIKEKSVTKEGLLGLLEMMKDVPREDLTKADILDLTTKSIDILQKGLCPVCVTSIFLKDNCLSCYDKSHLDIKLEKGFSEQLKPYVPKHAGRIIYNWFRLKLKESTNAT